MTKITSQVAQFITNTDYENLTIEAKEQAKYCFMDWIGVSMIGASEEASQIVSHFIKEQDYKKEATIINQNIKTSTFFAALANGISSHVLDLDDIYPWGPGHPSATVIPTALAMAEKLGSSGVEMLKAIIIGFQVQFAIGEAIMPQHYKEGWHNTSTLGRFGSTSAAASLLKMSTKKTMNALGIAATSTGGLKGVFGSMSKSFNAGKAGMDGILAVLLADQGFDSVEDSLENNQGFIHVFASVSNESNVIKALKGPLVIERVRPKKYASCYSTHSIIECMLSIHNQLGYSPKAKDIKSITYIVHPRCLEIAAISNPVSPLEARFSTQFCGASALKKGKMNIEDFSKKDIKDLEIIHLMYKTNFIVKEEYQKDRKAKAVIEFNNGQKLESSINLFELTKDRDKSNENIKKKFNILLSRIKSENSTRKLKDTILNLENISNIKEEFIPLLDLK